MHVVVGGAGIGGLGAALALARRGHRVTLVDGDAAAVPAPARGLGDPTTAGGLGDPVTARGLGDPTTTGGLGDPAAAFAAPRPGAPQVRHSHALLARLRNLLRDQYPDVLAGLLDAGARELPFVDALPATVADRDPRPGDEDLVGLGCRRTTFECVLRQVVAGHPDVEWRTATVAGLVATEGPDRSDGSAQLPRVVGLGLDDGSMLAGDAVVVAGGRRAPLARWLAEVGVDVAVHREAVDLHYFSQFYAHQRADALAGPKLFELGDLGYLGYGLFPGDNGIFSLSLAVPADDVELRRALRTEAGFGRAAAALPAAAPFLEDARPVGGVQVMAGLVNRRTVLADDEGNPLVAGLLAVGDAHTCTNPQYGRGCTLALVQAELLADAVDAWPGTREDDARARSRAFEAASAAEILPWYHDTVEMDRRQARARERARLRAAGGDPGPSGGRGLRTALLRAARTDPVVFRAMARVGNLLTRPESLVADADLVARVLAAAQAGQVAEPGQPGPGGNQPVALPLAGPDRDELLARLTG